MLRIYKHLRANILNMTLLDQSRDPAVSLANLTWTGRLRSIVGTSSERGRVSRSPTSCEPLQKEYVSEGRASDLDFPNMPRLTSPAGRGGVSGDPTGRRLGSRHVGSPSPRRPNTLVCEGHVSIPKQRWTIPRPRDST
ncbi:hypothetical protein E2C01_017198 [Portunus trituberculatus]|uniref:Uncharacterized protein n=1 Tax=Portunus trituberculatus TaxID=210409 RepID=A0A5B7DT46_PORTR|nr:hypothetical protein [Portunus trituberculatus]